MTWACQVNLPILTTVGQVNMTQNHTLRRVGGLGQSVV